MLAINSCCRPVAKVAVFHSLSLQPSAENSYQTSDEVKCSLVGLE
jgi:hypothetical protein